MASAATSHPSLVLVDPLVNERGESGAALLNPNGWYCYTALEVVGDAVLLGHCAGDRTTGNGLTHGRITRIPLTWFTDPLRKE